MEKHYLRLHDLAIVAASLILALLSFLKLIDNQKQQVDVFTLTASLLIAGIAIGVLIERRKQFICESKLSD